MDSATVVGAVIPSDVRPGRYRAGAYTPDTLWFGDVPVAGTGWIRVHGGTEPLVDKPQAGTEDFANLHDAPAAITRNRVL
jgi:hypothetical protein